MADKIPLARLLWRLNLLYFLIAQKTSFWLKTTKVQVTVSSLVGIPTPHLGILNILSALGANLRSMFILKIKINMALNLYILYNLR